NAAHIAAIIGVLADGPASADPLRLAALQTLGRGVNSGNAPAWTGEMRTAFQKLLRSTNPALPAATLPLVAKWDKEGRLGGEIKTLVAQLTIRLVDTTLTDDERAALVTSLLPVRQMNSEILPAVGKLLGSPASPTLQR